MLAFIARRLLATIPVLAMVAVFVFLMLRLTPGDPAAIIAGDNANAQQVAAIRIGLGLDRPLAEQFVIWVGRMLQGDFGESYFFKRTVASLIVQRIEPTVALATVTIILSVLIAVPLGVIAAYRHDSWIDRFVMALSVAGFSIPVFVIGYILIYVFAIQLGWLPVQGYRSINEGWWPFLSHMILPSAALGTVYMALIARITRATMLDVLSQDYIRTAQAKGLSSNQVLLGHALKNASVPIVTVIGIGIALLISGVVVTETVFAIPGIGRLTVDAILRRDYPIIQAVTLLFSGVYVLINLAVDMSYTFLDPRIRY
jgi:peptide/nickel transport system permease protein